MHNIESNSRKPVGLEGFDQRNRPLSLGLLNLFPPPLRRQYVLRMPIFRYYSGFLVPKELEWCWPLIQMGFQHQERIKVKHPFVYLTVRSGIVDSERDDEWHTDGFSTRITHLPEQNYVWSDQWPTQYVTKSILFPWDFDPLKHNVHKYIQKQVARRPIYVCIPRCVYCLDPYVIHRRPPSVVGQQRTFVRVSFTPIEILDKNNTPNPLLPVSPTDRDGVEIRNQLQEY